MFSRDPKTGLERQLSSMKFLDAKLGLSKKIPSKDVTF